MKNIFRYLASVLVGAMTLAACQQEIAPLGTEISVNPETVSVAGQNAGNETVTITADGDWIAVAPAWIKVAPANGGAGETTVTLSFADNVEEDGALAAARKGSVLFSVAEVSAELVVEQAGDPDKAPAEVQTITCAEFNAQEDGAGPFRVVGTIVSIKEVSAQYQNATLTINDGTADLYLYRVLAKDGEKIENLGLAVGDKITVEGKKGSYNGSPQMAEKTGVILEVEKSLISVSKVLPENPLALEGEDVMVSLMCKGEGLEVLIPENASWLTVASSEQSGELAVIVLSAAANDGGARKTDVEFVTTFNGIEYKAVVTVEQDGKVIEATIPEFIAAEVSIVVYEVTGTIVRASVNGDYNNADITIADADGNELYVFRMKPAGEANIVDYGLTVGDELTVQGQRAEYNGNPQMGNCVYVSHVDKEDPNAGEEIEVTPITIPELNEKAEAAGENTTDLSDEVNYELTAVVCGTSENSSYGTVYVMTKGATAAGNGFVLYNSSLEGKYNVGDEIKVTLKAGVAQVSQYNGNSQLSGVTDADVEVVSQNNEVAPVTVAAADLINYLGMPVIVENAAVAEGGVWCTENSHGNHKFSASGTEFSVYVNKRATVFQGVEYVAATGNISGIAVTYNGNLQLAPRDMEDVKAFAKTGDVEPADPWEGENVVSYDLPESASSSRQVLRNIKYYADESNINIRLVASVSKIAEVPTDGLTISLYDKTDGTVGKGFYGWWNDAKGDVEYNAERCGTITGSALVMSVGGTSIDVQTVVDGDLVTWTFAFPRSANPVMSNDKVYMGILTLDAGWNATGAMPDKYAEMLEVTLP